MNKVLEEAKEMELRYRSKIIELEKELEFESLRASEYENKFKEAVMEISLNKGDEQLLKQLIAKEEESSTLRKQIAEMNRKLSHTNNDTNQEEVEDLINQNNELRNVVEELKNAAIAAILEKDGEIEEMRLKLNDNQLTNYLAQMEDKNGELENLIKMKTEEYEDEIKKLNEKLANERNGFSEKLTKLHREMSHEENQKYKLLEKAQNLEGNLENLEKVIETYESKMAEIENLHSSERITYTKNEYELQKRIDELLDDIKSFEKSQNLLNATIVSLNRNVEEYKKKVEVLAEDKEELDRKLKIKNRKANPKDSSKSIFESFEGFSQKADVYASFSKVKDFTRESFIGVPTKLSDIQEIEIEEIENFSEYIQDLNEVEFERGERKKSENDEGNSLIKQQAQTIVPSNKVKKEQIVELEERIKSLLNEIDNCNVLIAEKTKEVQKERLDKLELKNKSLSVESELKVEREGLKVHIYKLENALLIEKLQNAERLESNKEIREYEKKVYEEQIAKLKTELEGSKKKKGLFGK